jgi:signal transduction histidine kinase
LPGSDNNEKRPTYGRLSLSSQFLLANLAIVVIGLVAIGAWVSIHLESSVLSRTTAIAALYVESIMAPHLQPLASRTRLDAAEVAAFDRLMSESALGEQIVAFRIWSPEGEVLYSPNRELIGQRFPVFSGLARALNGEVAAEVRSLRGGENAFELQRWSRLLEVYVPVRERGGSRILAVTEFYQVPDELDRAVAQARFQAWAVVSGAALVSYLLLAAIVKPGSDTIVRQEKALRKQVAELSRLLEQNAQLHERTLQAAGRTTALNEQALRRISADLHDGPGQELALALLRMDALEGRFQAAGIGDVGEDFEIVRGAVRDALAEIRAVSAGLRLPELAPLSVAEVAERAVRDHKRRGGAPVALHMENLPAEAPFPIKIALFRSLQEALSNATRHGAGAAVSARVSAEDDRLCLTVSDRGPGFIPEQVPTNGHLGLAGMRERAELLGGSFDVDSAPGRGTTICVAWPYAERGEVCEIPSA